MDFLSDRTMSDSVIGKQIGAALKSWRPAATSIFISSPIAALYFRFTRCPARARTPRPTPPLGLQGAGPFIDQAVKKFYGLRPIEDFDPELRIRMTLAALDALGGQMQQIFGRKNVVWVTHGVPLSYVNVVTDLPVDATGRMRVLAEKLELAQIVVYPVQQSIEGAGQDVGSLAKQTLELFAGLTGGRVYPSDSVDKALHAGARWMRGRIIRSRTTRTAPARRMASAIKFA